MSNLLYENEQITSWDAITGEDDKSLVEKEDTEVAAIRAEGKALENLKTSPGWKIVSSWMQDCVMVYTDTLVKSKDLDQMKRLQEAIKAYKNIEGFLTVRIDQAKSFDNKRTPE